MKAVHYTLTLCGTWLFEGVGVMAEELLINAGDSAYGCHSGEPLGFAEHSSRIEFIIQLVVPVNYIIRQLVSVGKASFNMPT